jgi:hypothetical protein
MDPITGMAIAGGVSSAIGAFGANSAAKKQEEAARLAAEMERRGYVNSLLLNEPGRFTGNQALNDINNFLGYESAPYTPVSQLLGNTTPITYKNVVKYMRQGASFDDIAGMGTLGTPGKKGLKRLIKAGLSMDQISQLQAGRQSQPQQQAAPQSSGPTGFAALENAPDYQFTLQQGTKNIGNTFAARGGAASGNALRALSEFNQGLASNQVDNFLNRRMNLVDGGSRATSNTQQAGQNYAQGYGNAQQAQGDARASGIMGVANSLANGLNGGVNNYLMGQYVKGMPQGGTGNGIAQGEWDWMYGRGQSPQSGWRNA